MDPISKMMASSGGVVSTYSMSSAADNVDEGSSLSFTVTTTNVADSTTLYWKVTTNAADFSTSTGTVSVTSNSGSFSVTPTADSSTEGSETFDVTLYTDSGYANSVASVTGITINDTSQAYSAWADLSTATYVRDNTFGYTTSDSWRALYFKTDGTKIFYSTAAGNIKSRPLSTAWDISTGGTEYTLSTDSTHHTSNHGLTFSADGTEMYSMNINTDHIVQYTLSTAWDLSTASYTGKFSVTGQEASPRDCSINSDGTKIYVVGAGADKFIRYDLSTAYDITSASYNSTAITTAGFPAGVLMRGDGSQIYVCDLTTDTLYQWDLSTNHGITGVTATGYDSSLYVGGRDATPVQMHISPDGNHLYFAGNANQKIYQYSL